MSQERAAVLVSAAAALVLGLAGCSDDAVKPKPLPSSSSTPSAFNSNNIGEPSSRASLDSPPVMPSAAMGRDARSARAFVQYWIAVLNYSGPAGRSARLRRLSGSTCVDCDAIADAIDTVRQNDGRIYGRGWSVARSVIVPSPRSNMARVAATVTVNPQIVVEQRGSKPRRFAGGRGLKVFDLRVTSDGWLVDHLKQSTG